MGWLIVCIVFFIIWCLYEYHVNELDFGVVILMSVVMFIIWIIVQAIGHSIVSNRNSEITYRSLDIESAFTERNWKLNGFIIGVSGGSYTEYVVYGKFNKGLKRLSLSANSTYIVERNVKPHIQNYWEIITYNKWEHWFWLGEDEVTTETSKSYHDKVMVVPLNTVYKEFELK